MSITIVNKNQMPFPLSTKDVEDGKAYLSDEGTIYIGNHIDDLKAFSICGKYVMPRIGEFQLREINLTITVSEI